MRGFLNKVLFWLVAAVALPALGQETAPEDAAVVEEAAAATEAAPAEAEPATEPEAAVEAAEAMPAEDPSTESAAEPAAESEAAPAAEAAFSDPGESGAILSSGATSSAAVETLQAERKLLETISKGVTLSLAQCEGVEVCEPNVNKAELKQLVKTVEQRIEGIVQRQAESPEPALDDLLIAYAIVRDTYSQQIDQLGLIAPDEDAVTEEGDLFGSETPAEGATESAAMPDEFSIFEDADESLSDEPVDEPEPEPAAEDPM